jgi:hypothetical protein
VNGPASGRTAWIEGLLAPRLLLLGAVLSFLACCWGGKQICQHNHLEKFERFHSYINLVNQYYPTITQIRNVAQAHLDREPIAVVIGGNSLLYGSGSGPEEQWSRHLQNLLGHRFQVINLAMFSASPGEFGAVAAEVLSQHYHRLILITDHWPEPLASIGDPDGMTYRQLFWEARARGWLLPDRGRDERLRVLGRERQERSFVELQYQVGLDTQLCFRDLWNTVAYKYFSTVWCLGVRGSWMRPRGEYADADGFPPLTEERLADRSVNIIKNLRGSIACNERLLALGDNSTSLLEQSICTCFPEECRKRTLMLIIHLNPFFVSQLKPLEQASYHQLFPITVRTVERTGMTAMEVEKGYSRECFLDQVHLSAEGGQRLAEEVAPRVIQLACKLGYLD